jgi:hypothetical protein
MAPISTTIEVERPATDVFAYVTDPARFSEWQQGVVDGHLDNPDAPAVGTKCFTTRRIGGSNRASTSELTSELTQIDPHIDGVFAGSTDPSGQSSK